MAEYILDDVKWILRRKNWKDFLKSENSILNEKNNNIAVLFVTCNSYANLKKCITYLEQESNQDFDIIIVDNSTKCKEIQLIHDLWFNKRISILKTIDNIWWSWWYSIWMEYIISRWYESLICFEDDVIPLDKDIISKTIELLKKNDIVGNIENEEDVFGMFHIRWYSVKLLSEKVWIVDPRFFLMRDDADFQYRCIKFGSWDFRINTWKKCYHPVLKKNRAWIICFHERNHLFYIQKYPMVIYHWRYMLINLFISILFWFSYYYITGQYEFIHATFYWICSSLFQKIWIQSNNKILHKFNKSLRHPKNVVHFIWDAVETNRLLKEKYDLYKKITWNTKLYSELVTSNNRADWKNWVVISWYISWRFAMRYKTIFCIDEYKYEEKKYYISIIDNKLKYIYLKMLLSLIIAGVIAVLTVIALIFKIMVENMWKIIKQ